MKYIKVITRINEDQIGGPFSFTRAYYDTWRSADFHVEPEANGDFIVSEVESGTVPQFDCHCGFEEDEELDLHFFNEVSKEFGCFWWELRLNSKVDSIYVEMGLKDAYLYLKNKEIKEGISLKERYFIAEMEEIMTFPHNANFLTEEESSS